MVAAQRSAAVWQSDAGGWPGSGCDGMGRSSALTAQPDKTDLTPYTDQVGAYTSWSGIGPGPFSFFSFSFSLFSFYFFFLFLFYFPIFSIYIFFCLNWKHLNSNSSNSKKILDGHDDTFVSEKMSKQSFSR
jgi:hypothetical protein